MQELLEGQEHLEGHERSARAARNQRVLQHCGGGPRAVVERVSVDLAHLVSASLPRCSGTSCPKFVSGFAVPRCAVKGTAKPDRWGTRHSVLPLHSEKPGADFGFLALVPRRAERASSAAVDAQLAQAFQERGI